MLYNGSLLSLGEIVVPDLARLELDSIAISARQLRDTYVRLPCLTGFVANEIDWREAVDSFAAAEPMATAR